MLSIDEFHLVAPNDDKMVSTQVLREIARIGRHYRLGLMLTTQSPADVDRSVLKRLLTRFVHTIEPDQLDSLRGIFADAPPEMIRSLPKLPRGTCVLTGVAETVRHAAVVDIRTRVTTPRRGDAGRLQRPAGAGLAGQEAAVRYRSRTIRGRSSGMAAEERKLDVREREQAIFRTCGDRTRRRGHGPRAARVTYRRDHAGRTQRQVRDTVTVQAYHKLVTRLVLDGRLVEVVGDDAEPQRYALAPRCTPTPR